MSVHLQSENNTTAGDRVVVTRYAHGMWLFFIAKQAANNSIRWPIRKGGSPSIFLSPAHLLRPFDQAAPIFASALIKISEGKIEGLFAVYGLILC